MSGQQAVLRLPAGTPEVKEVSIQPSVLVAGDHPAGLMMADYLAELGVSVTLLIPFSEPGEVFKPDQALMTADGAVAKLYRDLLEKVATHAAITIVPEAEVTDIEGWWGNFTVQARVNGESKKFQTSGVALAYRRMPKGGHDLFSQEGVISFAEFLGKIDPQSGSMDGNEPVKQVVFLLDVDARDEKWASVLAIRLGTFLRKNFGTQVFILCRDLKVSVDEMERDYRQARESGIIIFKYRTLPSVGKGQGGLSVTFEDAAAVSSSGPSEITLEGVDVVVAQEDSGFQGNRMEVFEKLRIPLEGGFAGPNNPQFTGRTPKKGVVVAGDSWYPEYPTDAAVTALSAAQELYKWVGQGTYQVDTQRVAEVDPSKCATCLTCFRICPHDSIRIERYGERNVYITKGAKEAGTWEAARVKVETCDGCGLCASECPAKAIQLVYYPDIEVLDFLGKNL